MHKSGAGCEFVLSLSCAGELGYRGEAPDQRRPGQGTPIRDVGLIPTACGTKTGVPKAGARL